MIFRLLYRLFLQGMEQRRRKQPQPQTAPTLTTPYRAEVVGGGARQRARKCVVVFVLAFTALLVLGWQLTRLPAPSRIMTDVDHAELRLHVLSSNTWPVVAYLQGTGLRPFKPSFAPSNARQIESVNGNFSPVFQVVPEGATIEIINSDAIAHNTHVFNRGGTIFNVALPLPGVTVKKTLTGSGIFSVRCDLHPWMQAWLLVPPSRYYGVVHEPGSISFTEVPPGEYVLHLWQAGSPEHIRLVELAAGESKSLRLR
jgi:plastocyanin